MVRRDLFLLPLAAAAQPHGGAEIEALEKAWLQAIQTPDAAALDRLLASDLIYGHASGVVDTKSTYIEKIRLRRQVYKKAQQINLTIRMHGDSAVTHCWAIMAGTNPAGPFDDRVMMMHAWARKPDGWKLVAHQTTKVDKLP
jgi:ketosteroid isomerase-like protein